MTDAPIIHLRSLNTGRVYRVVAVDKAAGTVMLRGRDGTFSTPWDPARLKEMGYERIIGPFEGMIETQ